MPPDESSGGPESAYCIQCGEQISPDIATCPECGATQDLESSSNEDDSPNGETAAGTEDPDQGGFTSWAIGFEPGNTLQNILVGLVYFFFWPLGIVLLVIGYFSKNDQLSEEGSGGEGITSWAIGFEPGNTGRNILVAFAYLLFWYIGIFLLIYAYPALFERSKTGRRDSQLN